MRKIFSAFLISLVSCSMLFSQGNVGIGTTTPNKGILDIVGNNTFSNLSVSNATGNAGMSLNFSEVAFNMYRSSGLKQFGNGYAGAINFSSGKMRFLISTANTSAGNPPPNLFVGTPAITIDTNRNVGIGSEFPSNFPGNGIGSKLLISKVTSDVNDPHLMIYSGTNLAGGVTSLHFQVGTFGRKWRLEGINASSLANERFNISNSSEGTILSVAGNNRVAIGSPATFATGYMLSVRGKIMCEELRVQLNAAWPDYVFEPEYKRLSLTDLEATVKLQKHLPGIPSAAEMAKENGILVGDFQQKLLEKMEELYLYVFELNNENKALRKQVEVLTTKVGE